MSDLLQLFVILLAGHYLADFPLQPAFVAEKKGLVFRESIGFHCLTSHAAVHGLVAAAMAAAYGVNHWFILGLIAFLVHWVVDFGKSSVLLDDRFPHTRGARMGPQRFGLYGINVDQSLHIATALMLAIAFG